MPYDPNLPQAGTEIDAVQMRGQLNGLKDLIDAIQSISSATVDGVNTLPPGEPATVTLDVADQTLKFTFAIPQGAAGEPFAAVAVDAVNTLPAGDQATVESSFDGSTVFLTFGIPSGHDGGEGPPFADVVVDAVNTLPFGDPATVESSFDGSTVFLTFGIPAGEPGPEGPEGSMGEVSQQQLDDAIATTSANSNAVDTLGLAVSDPPTQAEVQQIADKLDELILALRR